MSSPPQLDSVRTLGDPSLLHLTAGTLSKRELCTRGRLAGHDRRRERAPMILRGKSAGQARSEIAGAPSALVDIGVV